MKILYTLLLTALLSACASQRPKNDSDYEKDLIYPKDAYPLVFVEKKIFDDPMGGVMLRYVDENHPSDYITVYVYPIADISWDNTEDVLAEEMKTVLAEVDYMVQAGRYSSRTPETQEKFTVEQAGQEVTGLKAKFSFIQDDKVEYDSFAYLFIEEDKFIKFRTSFATTETQNWSGDEIVKKLLPGIKVPPESEYMKNLREQHRQKMAEQLLELLKSAEKQEGGKSP